MNELERYRIDHWAKDWFVGHGLSEELALFLTLGIDLLIITLIAFIADFIAKKIILRIISSVVKKTKTDWDDLLFEKKVFNAVAHIAPAIVVQLIAPLIFSDFKNILPLVMATANIYIVFVVITVINRLLSTVEEIISRSPYFKDKPVASYFQLAKIINYSIGGIFIFSIILNQSVVAILTAFGAVTAVLILVFKDTLLGLVASIQLSANDMIRVGDWVAMEKYGADGDVTEINLNTIKIQNWDKTISTIPTYAFIADSFKNWRGMTDLGVRRIKRTMHINTGSIRFCDDQMLEKYRKYELVRDYITAKKEEIKPTQSGTQLR